MYDQLPKIRTAKLTRKIFHFMESAPAQAFLSFILIVSLFLPDAWVLGNAPDSSDYIKWTIMLIIFILFILETIVLSFVQPGYFLGFFFVLDLLGTLSMILDIGWISNSFMPSNNDASKKGSLLRAARAAKLGARFGRLLRLLKFMKFVEYLPCLSKKNLPDLDPTMSSVRKVSNELSTVISHRVAFLVLTLVIVVPFLSYPVDDYGDEIWARAFTEIASSNSTDNNARFTTAVTDMVNFYLDTDYKVLSIYSKSPYIFSGQIYSQSYSPIHKVIRSDGILIQQMSYYDHSSYLCPTNDCIFRLDLDNSISEMWGSFFGIILMILVIVCLFGFVVSFNSVVEYLLVIPLERMMSVLRNSATVMLKSMKVIEEEKKDDFDDEEESGETDGELETELLEKMVEKLSRILKHAVPGAEANVVSVGNNIDSATATWLNQGFSTKNIGVDHAAASKKDSQIRVKHMHSAFVDPVKINSWDFDVLDYSHEQLFEIIQYLFETFDSFAEFSVSTVVFGEFVQEISRRYLDNTYHNFRHGCDVAHTVYRLLCVPRLNTLYSPLELFAIMTAALAHDVGHLGQNNIYLVKAKHKLALRHNDKSPLENMHCALLYDILSKAATNIFATLTETQWRESRRIIISAILGTDMMHHMEQINKVQLFIEVNGEDVKEFCARRSESIACLKDNENRLFILEVLLHTADISNPYKPFKICEKWADLVVEEFSRQGDKEKQEGLEVSPMMDRDTINLYNMQMGFIEFAVTPLVNGVINLFPPLHECGSNIMNNFQSWGNLRRAEIMKDNKIADKNEECRKLDERLSKFRDKMSFVANLRALDEASAGIDTPIKTTGRRKSVSIMQSMSN